MELNISQIDIVAAAIEHIGLKNEPLREELLDHLCCLVEEKISNGATFEKALQQCLVDFGDQELLAIEKEIVNQKKYKIMRNALMLTSILVLVFTSFLIGQKSSIPGVLPLASEFKVTAGFGERVHPITKLKKHHDGVDIKAPAGTPVQSPADGKVIKARDDKNKFGKHILIQHDERHQTFYSHLSSLEVNEGQMIKKGDLIGKVGNTGLSTAPHLHYEIIVDGEKVNPVKFIMDNREEN